MSVAEQMTLGSVGSAGMEEQEFVYRPIPALVPVSMAFVFISLIAAMWDVLLVIPLVGVLVAAFAWRQVRRSQGTLSGGWLAATSLMLQLAMLTGFGALHVYCYATEVPEGFERIRFKTDISKKGFTTVDGQVGIHPDVQKLTDKKVMIKGYMYPTKQMTNIKSFVLCVDNGDCCFGGQPKPSDMILVKMQDDKTVNFYDNKVMVAVSGVFRVQPEVDETGLQPVYQLEGEFFGKAKTLH